jgi:hypothetical protein
MTSLNLMFGLASMPPLAVEPDSKAAGVYFPLQILLHKLYLILVVVGIVYFFS